MPVFEGTKGDVTVGFFVFGFFLFYSLFYLCFSGFRRIAESAAGRVETIQFSWSVPEQNPRGDHLVCFHGEKGKNPATCQLS